MSNQPEVSFNSIKKTMRHYNLRVAKYCGCDTNLKHVENIGI